MPKYINIKEFRKRGFLQEANRKFFHPLGLALEIVIDDDGTERLFGVWDYRDDVEGILFDGKTLDYKKALEVELLRQSKLSIRRGVDGVGPDGIQMAMES